MFDFHQEFSPSVSFDSSIFIASHENIEIILFRQYKSIDRESSGNRSRMQHHRCIRGIYLYSYRVHCIVYVPHVYIVHREKLCTWRERERERASGVEASGSMRKARIDARPIRNVPTSDSLLSQSICTIMSLSLRSIQLFASTCVLRPFLCLPILQLCEPRPDSTVQSP